MAKSSATSQASRSGRNAQSRAGDRFRNLAHQNNFAKRARREGVPDINKLDLKTPEQWSNKPPTTVTTNTSKDDSNESWLFVPENKGSNVEPPADSTILPLQRKENAESIEDTAPQKTRRRLSTSTMRPLLTDKHEQPPKRDRRVSQSPRSLKTSDLTTAPSDERPSVPTNPSAQDFAKSQRSKSFSGGQKPALTAITTSQLGQRPSVGVRSTSFDEQNHMQAGRKHSRSVERQSLIERKTSYPNYTVPNAEKASDLPAADIHSAHLNPSTGLASHELSTLEKVDPYGISSVLGIPKIMITTKNGRHFNPSSEVLVHLSLGGHAVGDVKIVNLQSLSWFRTKLKVLKKPGDTSTVVNIAFQQDMVMNPLEWSRFDNQNLMEKPVGLGIIEAYKDTQVAADSLADYLENANVCAAWIYPDPVDSLIMILFSNRTPGWSDLGRKDMPTFRPRLFLWLRNSQEPLHKGPSQAYHFASYRSEQVVPNPSLQHVGALVDSPVETISPGYFQILTWRKPDHNQSGRESLIRPDISKKAPVRQDVTEITPASMSLTATNTNGSMNAPTAPTKLSHGLSAADFTYLTTVSSSLKRDSKRPRAFIAFNGTHPEEARVVSDWLGLHMKPRNIFVETESDGWKEFLEGAQQRISIVLFHENVPNYTSLVKLSSFLQTESLVCFNTCLDPSNGRISFSRLFPRGTTICITESCMSNLPTQTHRALKYFEENTIQGKKIGWKLILFPRALEWAKERLLAGTLEGEAKDR